MKPRIKQPESAYRPFWAVSVHSKSGIAHLVTQDLHKSRCGLYFDPYTLRSSGSSGIGAPRCKRCMVSIQKEQLK
jgi:hypothetical protein